MAVMAVLEFQKRQAQFFNSAEVFHPIQLLLECAHEALCYTVTLRFSRKARSRLHTEKGHFPLAIIVHALRPHAVSRGARAAPNEVAPTPRKPAPGAGCLDTHGTPWVCFSQSPEPGARSASSASRLSSRSTTPFRFAAHRFTSLTNTSFYIYFKSQCDVQNIRGGNPLVTLHR